MAAGALFGLLGFAGQTATAGEHDCKGEDLAQVKNFVDRAEITLIEAIRTAEHESGGTAMHATLSLWPQSGDKARGTSSSAQDSAAYHICCLADGKIIDVIVDSRSGDVLAANEAGALPATLRLASSNDPARPTSNDPTRAASARTTGQTSADPMRATSNDPTRATSARTTGQTSADTTRPTSNDPTRPTSNDPTRATSNDPTRATSARTTGQTAFRILKASDFMGMPVVNQSGEKLGDIEDLAIDTDQGRVAYAVLSFGGFLGMGDKWFAIPATALTLPPNHKHFVLAMDKDSLKNAPGFTKDRWPQMGDPTWESGVHKFYDQQPYWMSSGERSTPTNINRIQKASDIINRSVQNPQRENLGSIKDLVIDPDEYRVAYVVLSFGGFMGLGDKLFAMPVSVLQMPSTEKFAVLTVDKNRLKEANGFDKNQWPNLGDPTVASGIYGFYGQRPYGSDDQRSRQTDDQRNRQTDDQRNRQTDEQRRSRP